MSLDIRKTCDYIWLDAHSCMQFSSWEGGDWTKLGT